MQLLHRFEVEFTIKFIRYREALFIDLCVGKAGVTEVSGQRKNTKILFLYVDWRIKATPWKNTHVPLILPSGLHKLDENGKEINMTLPDSDSGILLRGPENARRIYGAGLLVAEKFTDTEWIQQCRRK